MHSWSSGLVWCVRVHVCYGRGFYSSEFVDVERVDGGLPSFDSHDG